MPPYCSPDPFAGALGFADVHNHQFANLAFGGGVLYGRPDVPISELRSCRREHGFHGLLDLAGNVSKMRFDHRGVRALTGHGTAGWPGFHDWPRWDDYTHQGVHRDWLRRAVDGGLRLMVMLALHNVELCRLSRRHRAAPCGTWEAVRAQLDAARQLERVVDREHGGPGRGWYRIVDSPEEADDVIASGRLAVVLGAEVDDLFSLRRRTHVDGAELDAMARACTDLGIHHLIPVHFIDNGVGGAAFQELSWAQDQPPLSTANPLGSVPLYRVRTVDGTGSGYAYRGGRINALGLTPAGRGLLERLMRRGVLVDVEHMSTRSRSDTLDLAEELGRPVVSGHATFRSIDLPSTASERELTDLEHRRILASGGMVAPIVRQATVDLARLGEPGPSDTARGLLAALRHAAAVGRGRPVGIGTDLNGFAGGTRPRGGRGNDDAGPRISYPFRAVGIDGARLDRAVTGTRTFDVAVDGLAHVGLLPDLVAELEVLGASFDELGALLRSAQGYVEVWRRGRESAHVRT